MIDVYAQNTTLPHPSISSSHGLPCLHAHESGGIAERENPFDIKFKRQTIRFAKKSHEQRDIIEEARWLKQLCQELGIPRRKGVASAFSEVTYQLSKEIEKGYDNVVIDVAWLADKLDKSISSVYAYVCGLERTGLVAIEWVYFGNLKYPSKIKFTLTYLLMNLLLDKEKCFSGMEHMRESYIIFVKKLSTIPSKMKSSLLQHNMLEFYSSREKNVTEINKSLTRIIEEKKAASETASPSATPEEPQYRMALKVTKAKKTIDPLSETPTKPTEPQSQQTSKPFQKSWREKKRAGKTEQRILRTPDVENILQEGWEYFKSIFQKEGEKPVLACSEEDFKTIFSSRMPSHFSTFQHINTYLDKISINQLLMGKRVMTNGKVWDLRLGYIFEDKVISASHNPYGQWPFISYNERDLSKKEGASVPKDMLEKLNFSQDQLDTVCEVVNEHLQHLEEKLVDKSASKLTPDQIQKLIAVRPVNVAPIPSESIEKAGVEQGMEKHTQDEKTLLGDVFNPFDEAVKNHLFKVLPYNTYKAWMIDAKASFEETEYGWKVKASRQFSQNQIEIKFSQFIDQAHRDYISQKAEVQDQGQTLKELESSEESQKPEALEAQENLPRLQAFPEIPVESNVTDDRQANNRTNSAELQIEKTLSAEENPIEPQQQLVSRHYSGSLRRILHSFIAAGMLSGWAQAVEIKSCLTPQQQRLPLIVREPQKTPSENLMQVSSRTPKPISKEVRETHDRVVNVKMLIDPSQEGNSHFADFSSSSGEERQNS
jgi:hypothetical protein